jgi:hypothetical protein
VVGRDLGGCCAVLHAELMGAPAAVHLKLALNADATPEKVEPERKVVEEFLKAIGLPFKVETDMKARELTVSVAAPEDPFALAGQMGLDLKTFVKELSLALEVPVSPAEVLDANDTRPIADLIGLRFDTKLEFRKYCAASSLRPLCSSLSPLMCRWFVQSFGAHTCGHFARRTGRCGGRIPRELQSRSHSGLFCSDGCSFLCGVGLTFRLVLWAVGCGWLQGNVKDVLASMLPPAGLNPAHAGAALPPQLMQFAKVAKFLTKDGSRQKMIGRCTRPPLHPAIARSLARLSHTLPAFVRCVWCRQIPGAVHCGAV